MIPAPLPKDAPIGIYVHVPFCAHICPYCDFTTYAGKESLIGRYVTCVERELTRIPDGAAGRPVATIFLGGGTPSLLDPAQATAIIAACHNNHSVVTGAEITMECNPNALTAERLAGYREAGVNRLSIGAQTMDRRGLRTLGRQHESSDVLTALTNARLAVFDNVSLDFIFGWPNQSLDNWKGDLDTVLSLAETPEHLSLYSLIVEPGTPFADAAARGILHMPDDDATADMYEQAITSLDAAGWHHYEVANWSRDAGGHSRHNAIYWQHGDYLGIGAGAHGTIGSRRTMNHLLPETYCQAIEAGTDTASNVETIDEATSRVETMLLGLRLLDHGVDARAFQVRHGVSLDDAFGPTIDDLIGIGMMERHESGLRLTRRGLMLANDVVARFL
ncbi:MAG: radical SAM family heme chaperone HemW [Chloroflexota bacterium]|nr:radical SAM family heme chaperone HemW [Chloroflexota bacterium]